MGFLLAIGIGFAAAFAIAAVLGAVAVLIAVVCVAMLAALAAAIAVHIGLALVVLTRRPPTYVWMSRRGWSLITLIVGLPASAAFFLLHSRLGRNPRCYRCGYSMHGLRATVCPECGTAASRGCQGAVAVLR